MVPRHWRAPLVPFSQLDSDHDSVIGSDPGNVAS